MAGEEVATCPSCSLVIRIIYDRVSDFILSLKLKKFYLRLGFQEKFKAEEDEVILNEKLKELNIESN